MNTPIPQLDPIHDLRHQLHQYPDLSGDEAATAKRIISFLENYHPDQVLTGLGGNGIAAIFKGKEEGPTVMFRSELDALPIQETNDIDYRSRQNGISHKCGHDGHMSMVAGIAPLINEHPLQHGTIILLFQPAEESGQGASWLLKDQRFTALKPDYIFGLHNVPGYPLGQVLSTPDVFAAASKGMINRFKGKPSHAAHPEGGINPAFAISEIVNELNQFTNDPTLFRDFVLATIIHLNVGEVAFGTSPGEGALMLTLRSFRDDDMEVLRSGIERIIDAKAKHHQLKFNWQFTEEFPVTNNTTETYNLVKDASLNADLNFKEIQTPFRWSEDFGNYSKLAKTGFWGLGSGIHQPQLHHEHFDFPDELIPYGITIYSSIIDKLLS